DPWRAPEWITVASGAAAAITMVIVGTTDPESLVPLTYPLTWPPLPILPLVAIALTLAPAWVTPQPPRNAVTAATSPRERDTTPSRELVA
ncbi:MAG: energy-coupling factor transporter transmembrane protein EcfT, partial [Candidatus Nanopelagicales bacterium]